MQSQKAIILYNTLIKSEKVLPLKFSSLLSSRILDQLTILHSLDLELRSILVKNTHLLEDAQSTADKWTFLSQGKITMKNEAEAIVVAVLDFHQVFFSTLLMSFYRQLSKRCLPIH